MNSITALFNKHVSLCNGVPSDLTFTSGGKDMAFVKVLPKAWQEKISRRWTIKVSADTTRDLSVPPIREVPNGEIKGKAMRVDDS
jgi:hypothetical protein